MFKELLEEVVTGTDGGIAALLMGFDGIAVDHYVRDDGSVDVDSIGMEYSVVLKDIQKAATMLDAGDAQEVAIRAERMTTLIRIVNEQYFVALAVTPSGNVGKGRFLLRTRVPKMRDALE
ncbi:MAG: roadblock/LC7 domain-containing protein [Polyangiales bacterium]